jgi:putative nucleotidyltransferase with HDIG domain
MEKDELRRRIYSKIEELPTLPAVLPKLLGVIEEAGANASDIADVIVRDPALTSKILRVANSAYYGFQQKISSLDQAVPLLGLNMVKCLAMSIGVIRGLPSHKNSAGFSWEGLWVHSLAVATVMQALGKRSGKTDQSDYLFVVGLLHDIGKIVLDQFFSDLFQAALEAAGGREYPALHVEERRIVGLDHGEIGAMLLRRWKFPDMISDPIAVHHRGMTPDSLNEVDVAMLRIADSVPRQIGLGEGGDPLSAEDRDRYLERLNMTEEDLAGLRDNLERLRDGIHAFYGAMA